MAKEDYMTLYLGVTDSFTDLSPLEWNPEGTTRGRYVDLCSNNILLAFRVVSH